MTPHLARVTSYAEADEILTSRRFVQESKHESAAMVGGTVLVLDGIEHQRRRRLLAPLVDRESLANYDAVVARTLESCVRAAAEPCGDGFSIDLVPLGRAVFLQLAAAMIGFDGVVGDEGATAELLALLGPILEAVTVEWSTRDHAEVLRAGESARDALVDRFLCPIASGRHLLGLLGAHPQDWDEPAAVREVVLFLAASTLNNAALLVHVVEELAALGPGEHDLVAAVAETLRLYPPTVALLRRAVDGVVLRDGRRVRAGEYVAVDLAAANRDPEAFGADSDVFRPGREPAPRVRPWGLTFGSGPHLCLGRAIVTGTPGTPGVHLQILRRLRALGVTPDPRRPPVMAPTAQRRHESYPALLRSIRR